MKRQIYVFYCIQTSSIFGLTQDQSGNNLPLENCNNWKYRETIQIGPDDPSLFSGIQPAEILAAIDQQGYYLTEIKIIFQERH